MATKLIRKGSSEVDITQYDITVTPNDFNVNTIFDLIKSGNIEMPFFQRNYVWDQRRASQFIESLILGLPIPQIFLYQKERNKFLVIDGQQRLLTIYYFMNQRFPRKEMRTELRQEFDKNGRISESIFSDDKYFIDFKLTLPHQESGKPHPLNNAKYLTLEETLKSTFEFMPIRCMSIRQNSPKEDDSSIFEIFNRLNTGGLNLSEQEIRACLYASDFYNMLNKLNNNKSWRSLWGNKQEDGKSRDVETLLRCFALLCDSKNYTGNMKRFLNRYAKSAMEFSEEKVKLLHSLFDSFISLCDRIEKNTFKLKNGAFNTALFDCVFVAILEKHYLNNTKNHLKPLSQDKLNDLKADQSVEWTHNTTHTKSVQSRIELAKKILL
jgi:uncharacterized protein with ParB-like and HNH nuclease domain